MAKASVDPTGRRRRTTPWLVAGVFVLGLLLGVAGTLVWGSTSPSFGPRAGRSATPPPPSPSAVPAPGSGAEVTVDAACLQAVRAAQSAASAIADAGDALATLDAARLDQLVRRLQPIQDQLRTDGAACHVAAATAGSSPAGPSAGSATASSTMPPAPSSPGG